MKEKILLLIITFLFAVIIYINYNNYFTIQRKPSQVNSQVKSAQALDNKIFDFSTNLKKIPTKNTNYSDPDNIYAKSFILIDLESSIILTAFNENEKNPIASTTKLMTAIIAIENYDLDDIVTVKQHAIEQYPTNVGLELDEKIKVIDLLHCLLIRSGNDSAYALADHMGFDNFISKMNEKAKYLGLSNTNFRDPAGLDDNGFSTARDLAFLLSYALKQKTISDIIKISHITVNSYNIDKTYDLTNSNRLIQTDEDIYYENSIGGKTGYTPDAGHCLLSASRNNDHTLIAVILNTYEDTAIASAKESKKLFEWGYKNYKWQ